MGMNFPGTELPIKDQRKKNGGNQRALITEHIFMKKRPVIINTSLGMWNIYRKQDYTLIPENVPELFNKSRTPARKQ